MADGASMSVGKIFMYVLAGIVLITFILWWFRVDIDTYFQNLPGLGPRQDGQTNTVDVDITTNGSVDTLCPYQVGSWKTENNRFAWGIDLNSVMIELRGTGSGSNDIIYTDAASSSSGLTGDIFLRSLSRVQLLNEGNVIGEIKSSEIKISAVYLPFFFVTKTSDVDYYSDGDDYSFTPSGYYENIDDYGSMPSFQTLVNFDGAYIAREGKICRSQPVDYESEVERRIRATGESNVFVIRYTSGFDDLIAFKWSFNNNQPAVNIITNDRHIDNANIYGNKFVYGLNGIQARLNDPAVKDDLYPEEIAGILKVMNSSTPDSFVGNIWTFLQQNPSAQPFGVSVSFNEITRDSISDILYTTTNKDTLIKLTNGTQTTSN